MIGLHHPYNKPPQLGAKINRGHHLARGLVAFWPLWEMSGEILYDVARTHDIDVAWSGTPTWTIGRYGPGLLYADGDQIRDTSPDATLVAAASSSMSIYIAVQTTGYGEGGFGRISEFNNNAAGHRNFSVWYRAASGGIRYRSAPNIGSDSSSQTNDWGPTGFSITSYQQWLFSQSIGNGSRILYRQDFGNIQKHTNVEYIGGATDANRLTFGNAGGSDRAMNGTMYDWRLWDRELDESEARTLFINPWQIFTRTLPVWINTAAAAPSYVARSSIVGLPV